ncbi:MAG: phosphoribosylformylglycinamidine cyclo-ligase [Xanthomonadales bacterium]|nr:phosphoribosylformylglycinamidine cyclo-ligase [Xanthomonadales bacterium]MDH4019025.1 phosphoribosylformylglycinamidine cyclo-ligase [Xanthomonadales bacterium]
MNKRILELNIKTENPTGLSYLDAGVDIDAGNELVERIKPAVKSTNRSGVITGLGGFGGLFQLDTTRYKEPLLVSGTDGVGTKLLLAKQLDRHDTIGIDLVAMCVNDILTCGAEPLFFLDYYATGKLKIDNAQAVIEGIANGCRQAGCALIGGETAEMPGLYDHDEYDLAGFTVGAVDRSKVIDGSQIKSGHIVLGLESSGPHSNGYSLIRKVLEQSGDDTSMLLGDTTLGEALLAPTRIYVKPLLKLIEQHTIDGLAHITGGGISENITRVIPEGLGIEIDLSSWQMPAVFQWLQTKGGIEEQEMLRTFNCGIGMALLVAVDSVDAICQTLAEADEPYYRLGSVIDCPDSTSRVHYIRS